MFKIPSHKYNKDVHEDQKTRMNGKLGQIHDRKIQYYSDTLFSKLSINSVNFQATHECSLGVWGERRAY